MKHHYINSDQIQNGRLKIIGQKFHHLKDVLKIKTGDRVNFFDGSFEYLAEISEISKKEITAIILEKKPVAGNGLKVWLAQALPKAGKMDLIVQKISEIGLTGLLPFQSGHCEGKVEIEKIDRKLAHWQEVAVSAAEQSGRPQILKISPLVDWEKLLISSREFDLVLFFWEKAEEGLKKILRKELAAAPRRILLVVGPEGSFTEKEIESVRNLKNVRLTSLGKNILRAETAGIIAGGLVLYEWGMLG